MYLVDALRFIQPTFLSFPGLTGESGESARRMNHAAYIKTFCYFISRIYPEGQANQNPAILKRSGHRPS